VSPRVATEDLIDAQVVADLLCLSHRNSVSLYQRRYDDMPRPVVDLGDGRVKLWLWPEIERWAAKLASSGRTRPARRAAR
jgi:hypothetical protein